VDLALLQIALQGTLPPSTPKQARTNVLVFSLGLSFPLQKIMSRWDDIAPKMLEYARRHVAHAGEGLSLLPGVLELLKALAERKDVVTGLVRDRFSHRLSPSALQITSMKTKLCDSRALQREG
jgi:hypothetical protein